VCGPKNVRHHKVGVSRRAPGVGGHVVYPTRNFPTPTTPTTPTPTPTTTKLLRIGHPLTPVRQNLAVPLALI
jgi:hypothetical protein